MGLHQVLYVGYPLTTTAHAMEQVRLQRIIEAHERELDHRANVISEQADRITTLEGELDDAVSLGTGYAVLGRALGGVAFTQTTTFPPSSEP